MFCTTAPVQMTGAWRTGRGLGAPVCFIGLSFSMVLFVDCIDASLKAKPK